MAQSKFGTYKIKLNLMNINNFRGIHGLFLGTMTAQRLAVFPKKIKRFMFLIQDSLKLPRLEMLIRVDKHREYIQELNLVK